jgi:hypothetical protein
MSGIKKKNTSFLRRFQKCKHTLVTKCSSKKLLQNFWLFKDLPHIFRQKRGLSGITFLGFGTKVSIYFWNLHEKTNFFIPDMTHFERKKFSRLFRPQSADWKTSFALQLAEKHFTAQVIFQKKYSFGSKSILLASHFHILPIEGG